MIQEIEELYQEVILDHSRRPRNFGELPDAAVLVHGDNPACGDEIHLAVKFDGDGGLEDIKFTRIPRSRDGGNERCVKGIGRSSRDAGSPKISAASKMRDAPLAGGRASARAGRGRSDCFNRTALKG